MWRRSNCYSFSVDPLSAALRNVHAPHRLLSSARFFPPCDFRRRVKTTDASFALKHVTGNVALQGDWISVASEMMKTKRKKLEKEALHSSSILQVRLWTVTTNEGVLWIKYDTSSHIFTWLVLFFFKPASLLVCPLTPWVKDNKVVQVLLIHLTRDKQDKDWV